MTYNVFSGTLNPTHFTYGSNDPANSVKALSEVVVLRTRLQSHQVHLTMLQSHTCIGLQYMQLECGPMPDVMAALPNIGPWRPLFNTAKFPWRPVLVPSSNAAKTRKPLKVTGVPQTPERISATSRPKFTILWGHVKEILLLNRFFPIVNTCLSCEDIA